MDFTISQHASSTSFNPISEVLWRFRCFNLDIGELLKYIYSQKQILSKMGKVKSENLYEIMKKCNNFNELPDPDPQPERKIFLQQCKPSSKSFSKRDIKARNYENYLRFEYGCSEAIPGEFDPEKLEAVLQAKLKLNTENRDLTTTDSELHRRDEELSELDTTNEYQEFENILNIIYSEEINVSSGSLSDISVTESLDSDEQLDEYENEAIVTVASAEKFTRASPEIGPMATVIRRSAPEPIVRKPTPRIRTGSKPPLSRSAFARAGLPSPKDGSPATTTLRGYPKAPKYFPYKSKARSA
ncbi:uncharacterized protein F4807DRAFT_423953 [Annulohypoxylon truncatum]|uniref:uncharacterized protein n=1 Tax=Annulohypoxylon truncatum TaxID=327061 RepID=UPI002007D6AB|nr:uncharacterized protein F4807DRAFT_423953 [Annulohypoxylon truncatum]KAI1210143.1 hypothetical protein F4807DRAFT_423953 [Annulohypoxylon truncatum]